MSDLISRQAVENITWEEPSYTDPLNVLTEVREKVRALPSVENKGEWKMPVQDDGMSDPIYYQVRCSKCGFDLDPQTWHQELHQYGADNFCPNCGADMRKPKGLAAKVGIVGKPSLLNQIIPIGRK